MTRSDSSASSRASGAAPAPRVLITGVNGFTGRYMAARLAADGYRVWGTVRAGESLSTEAFPFGVTAIEADLLDRGAIAHALESVQPDVVVHLAAVAHVADSDIA